MPAVIPTVLGAGGALAAGVVAVAMVLRRKVRRRRVLARDPASAPGAEASARPVAALLAFVDAIWQSKPEDRASDDESDA